MNRKIFCFSIFLLFLVLTLVSAQPPAVVTGDFTDGFVIKNPPQLFLPQNQDFIFHFHVFNRSNGVPILNNTLASNVVCYFHLYNPVEQIYIANQSNNEDVFDFEFEVLGGNFSVTGSYAYIIQCNNSFQGGENNVAIEITATGNDEISTAYSNRQFVIIFFTLALFIIAIILYVLANRWNLYFFHFLAAAIMFILGLFFFVEGIPFITNTMMSTTIPIIFFALGMWFIIELVLTITSESEEKTEEEIEEVED